MEPGDKVEIVVVFGKIFTVIKTTVYLIYEPIDDKMDQCYAPDKNVLVGSGDDNECIAKRMSLQVEPADDL